MHLKNVCCCHNKIYFLQKKKNRYKKIIFKNSKKYHKPDGKAAGRGKIRIENYYTIIYLKIK